MVSRPSNHFHNFGDRAPGPSGRNVQAVLVEKKALQMRERGMSYEEIAAELRISEEAAGRAVRRALKEAKKIARESASEIIDIELKRLDTLYLIAMEHVRRGDITAIDRALKVMERRAKFLGLDAAVKAASGEESQELNLNAMTPEQLDQLEQLMMAAAGNSTTLAVSENDDYGEAYTDVQPDEAAARSAMNGGMPIDIQAETVAQKYNEETAGDNATSLAAQPPEPIYVRDDEGNIVSVVVGGPDAD